MKTAPRSQGSRTLPGLRLGGTRTVGGDHSTLAAALGSLWESGGQAEDQGQAHPEPALARRGPRTCI